MRLKLDNKGWGFTTFILYLAIFVIFIGIVTFLAIKNADSIKPNNKQNSDYSNTVDNNMDIQDNDLEIDYTDIEKDLENAAYQYQQEYLPSMNNGDIKYVTATKLEELKFLDNLTNGDILCTGYAKITYNNGKNEVMAFVNCGDYITEGYNEELDK